MTDDWQPEHRGEPRPRRPERPSARPVPWPLVGGIVLLAILTVVLAILVMGGGTEPVASNEPSPSAGTSGTTGVASPTVPPSMASPASSVAPLPSPSTPDSLEGRVAVAMADGLAVREEWSVDAALVGRVNAGQTLGIRGGPVEAEGMEWYGVGPGALTGWVSSGPDGDWLRLVEDGAIGFVCDTGCDAPALVSVAPFDDSATTAIAEEVREWTWSPDGTRIAATFDGGTGQSDIFVMEADGSNRRRLGSGYDPAWSPEGSRLAWTSGSALVVTDENLVPTELELDIRGPGRPLWAPDGTRIAFGAIDCPACPADEPIMGDPPLATWVVGIDGSGLRQLTGGDYSGLVHWSPDGSTLLFVQYDLSGEFPTRVYTLPAAGGERSYLASDTGIAVPAWSPDGGYLAYGTEEAEIIVALPDGSSPRAVATAPASGIGLIAWSPSGEWLLFESLGAVGEGPALWIVPFDGAAPPRQLSPSGASVRSPAWQPVLAPMP